jgi:tight adherence protein B
MALFVTLVLCGFVVFGFFLLVDGLIYIIANTGDRGESRRLRRLALNKKAQHEIESAFERLAREEKPVRKLSLNDYIDSLITQTGVATPRNQIYLQMAIMAVAAFVGLILFASNVPIIVRVVIAIVFGFAFPILRLKGQASKRVAAFGDQFPDTLDLIVRSLRIGHPLTMALQTVAREMPAPTGPEFEIVARQIVYGKTAPQAIGLLAERMPSSDLRFFSVAVQIQAETGGNLSDILSGLAKIIRARFQLFRKVRALTAEGRFSAYFLSAFPGVVIVAMNALQPGYYEKVADFQYFPHLLGLTSFLLILNIGAMRLMTRLEV